MGTLSVNKKIIYDSLFGGEFLNYNEFIYVPVYVKRFLGWGFRLAKINIIEHNCSLIGKVKALIFLDKIENNRVYYFED